MPSQGHGDLIDVNDQLFAGVDHNHVAHMTRAFDIMAERLGGVSNSSALWALATLVAKILASTAMDPVLMDAMGQRFSGMLKTAYPAMVRALEDAQRQQEGRPPYDA
jgi:hypothetical protein